MQYKKKFAVLIMAHHDYDILEKLMCQLDHPRNDIYIHIDKKSRHFDKKHFENICTKSRVIFIPRMRTYWGDSSLVECELRLMEAALQSGEDYSYFHLLSGQDLQIKHSEEIMNFFDQNPNRQFLALRYVASGIRGMSRYFFFMKLRYYNKYIAKALDIVSEKSQKLLKINRLKGTDYQICKCQQWVSITKECAEYIISQRPFIKKSKKKFVKFSNCSDEMFIGTVIVNSPFRNEIYHPYRSLIGHMRLIDRDRPEGASPHTWLIEDWDTIVASPCFWARKFDSERDSEIINKVYETWR